MDEPIVNKLVPNLAALVNTIGERCRCLTERKSDISSRTDFAWWPKNQVPS